MLRFIVSILFILVLALICQVNFDLFIFDKSAIQNGEYWRVVTGHFTHSSLSHGFWNVLAFSASLVWLSKYSVKIILPSIVAVCLNARKYQSLMGALPLLVVLTKLIVDFIFQQTVFVDTGWVAYPESHLVGALAGVLMILGFYVIKMVRKN